VSGEGFSVVARRLALARPVSAVADDRFAPISIIKASLIASQKPPLVHEEPADAIA